MGGGDTGLYISADIIPALSYDSCFYVFVLYDRTNPTGITERFPRTLFFGNIGHLDAGQKKELMVDVDRDKVPRFPSLLVLVFSHGLEIESNQADEAAWFFRQEDLCGYRKRLAAYIGENRTGDSPVQNYLSIAPELPQAIPVVTLPAKIEAKCTVSCGGLVESIELPRDLPVPVAQEVARAVSGWLFLPKMQKGLPQTAMIQIPIVLREEGSAR